MVNWSLLGSTKKLSGRFLFYLSNHPKYYKIGTIFGLVDRAIFLSHSIFHEKNVEFCINILFNNDHPLDVVFRTINHRIKIFGKRLEK